MASKFKYQGQELEEGLDYNMYEFELRHYDATIGRFVTTDPYEQFMSPYLAMGNNPVVSFDPDGGYCTDANGNQITCPDDPFFDDYRDDKKNGVSVQDEIDITPSSNSSLTGFHRGKIVDTETGDKIAPSMNERPDSFRRDFDELMLNLVGYYSYVDGQKIHHVDANGIVVAAAPLYNDSGSMQSIAGGLPIIRIGKYAVAARTLHKTIKPKILKKVGKKAYEKIVGRNPDIAVEKGMIILKGNGPFKNKIYKTNLNADTYLK